MKYPKRVWQEISDPFLAVAVLVDDSKRINEDGSWDKYWQRKNRRKEKGKNVSHR